MDKEKVQELVNKAKKAARDGELLKSLNLFNTAYKIHPSEKLQKRIEKLQEFIDNMESESEDDDAQDEDMIDIGSQFLLHKSIAEKLYDYQKKGVLWFWKLFKKNQGGILGDDMGLGKTIQVIGFLAGMYDAGLIKHVIIVAPLAILINWEKEFTKWIPQLKARKNDLIIWVYLSDLQLKLYQGLVRSERVKQAIMTTRNPLAELNLLKKISDHPRLQSTLSKFLTSSEEHETRLACGIEVDCDEDEDGSDKIDEPAHAPPVEKLIDDSGKMVFLVYLMNNLREEKHRTVIFSQSRKMLDIIQKVLLSFEHKILRLDGTISNPMDREKVIEKFQRDVSYNVILMTTQVGSVGLTLTGADRLVIFDPSWNPGTDAQAVDRVYRLGQTKDVIIYRLITCGSVEEKIYRKQIFKNALMKQTTGASNNPYRYFTNQELRELFVLDDPRISTTQQQLEEMHGHFNHDDQTFMKHLEYLDNKKCIFGVSHHDQLFSQEAVDDNNEEFKDVIKAQVLLANQRLTQEHNFETISKPMKQNKKHSDRAGSSGSSSTSSSSCDEIHHELDITTLRIQSPNDDDKTDQTESILSDHVESIDQSKDRSLNQSSQTDEILVKSVLSSVSQPDHLADDLNSLKISAAEKKSPDCDSSKEESSIPRDLRYIPNQHQNRKNEQGDGGELLDGSNSSVRSVQNDGVANSREGEYLFNASCFDADESFDASENHNNVNRHHINSLDQSLEYDQPAGLHASTSGKLVMMENNKTENGIASEVTDVACNPLTTFTPKVMRELGKLYRTPPVSPLCIRTDTHIEFSNMSAEVSDERHSSTPVFNSESKDLSRRHKDDEVIRNEFTDDNSTTDRKNHNYLNAVSDVDDDDDDSKFSHESSDYDESFINDEDEGASVTDDKISCSESGVTEVNEKEQEGPAGFDVSMYSVKDMGCNPMPSPDECERENNLELNDGERLYDGEIHNDGGISHDGEVESGEELSYDGKIYNRGELSHEGEMNNEVGIEDVVTPQSPTRISSGIENENSECSVDSTGHESVYEVNDIGCSPMKMERMVDSPSPAYMDSALETNLQHSLHFQNNSESSQTVGENKILFNDDMCEVNESKLMSDIGGKIRNKSNGCEQSVAYDENTNKSDDENSCCESDETESENSCSESDEIKGKEYRNASNVPDVDHEVEDEGEGARDLEHGIEREKSCNECDEVNNENLEQEGANRGVSMYEVNDIGCSPMKMEIKEDPPTRNPVDIASKTNVGYDFHTQNILESSQTRGEYKEDDMDHLDESRRFLGEKLLGKEIIALGSLDLYSEENSLDLLENLDVHRTDNSGSGKLLQRRELGETSQCVDEVSKKIPAKCDDRTEEAVEEKQDIDAEVEETMGSTFDFEIFKKKYASEKEDACYDSECLAETLTLASENVDYGVNAVLHEQFNDLTVNNNCVNEITESIDPDHFADTIPLERNIESKLKNSKKCLSVTNKLDETSQSNVRQTSNIEETRESQVDPSSGESVFDFFRHEKIDDKHKEAVTVSGEEICFHSPDECNNPINSVDTKAISKDEYVVLSNDEEDDSLEVSSIGTKKEASAVTKDHSSRLAILKQLKILFVQNMGKCDLDEHVLILIEELMSDINL